MKAILSILIIIFLTACNDNSNNGKNQKDAEVVVDNPADKIPDKREVVKKEPVAEYREKTDNPLNDWYFSVRLYETPKTFHYLIKLQYEEIDGTDTLRLPNFGIEPKPVIQKGDEKYSCIIGFMDKENKFREYKKVFAKNNRLRIVALKHYAVYTTQKEDSTK